MRVADKMQFEQVKGSLNKNRSDLHGLQNQAATQRRVTKPSDDPLAATRVLTNRADVQSSEQYIKNVSLAKSFLDTADQSLGELTDIFVRAKELALIQANDASGNASSRRVTATEIDQLLGQAIQVGNRKLGDRFIFAGFKTQHAPFTPEGEYQGDDGEIFIQINKDSHLAMNMPGNLIFLGDGLSKDGLFTPSQKVPASTDELKQQRIDEQRRNSEKAKQQAEAPQTLDVRGPASVVVSGGTSARAKDEQNVYPQNDKGLNLFGVLRDLSIGLKTDHKATIQDSLDRMDDAIAQVVFARSHLGARSSALENTNNALTRGIVDSKISSSQLEDADTVSLVSDISKQQSTLQATLQTSGKLIQPSLLDFLR